jgi:hypothetical protein
MTGHSKGVKSSGDPSSKLEDVKYLQNKVNQLKGENKKLV